MNVDDTIATISSASGGAMRGIVRLSGPGVLACLADCFRSKHDFAPAKISAAAVLDGHLLVPLPIGELPCDLYLWPDARSYTRQPVAEIHTIGSPPLLDAALQTVCAAGARLAEPGEFTMRSFLAGRMDLTQAEAVLGVIDANSQKEFDIALTQLAGGMAGPLEKLRSQLLDLLAQLEAGLDFVEEDIEFVSPDRLHAQLQDAANVVARLADQMTCRGESSGAFRVVLIGWPNVGKSSLLNVLGGERAAMVSKTAGTTRDYVTRRTEIDGLDCLLIDTAGIEADSDSVIAAMAQTASAQQSDQAHVELFCIDATRRLNAEERQALTPPRPPNRVLVLTKIDAARSTDLHLSAVETSSLTGEGLSELRRTISLLIMDRLSHESSVVAGTAVRCRESLRSAAESLDRARHAVTDAVGEEIVAAEIRVALDELGKVVGAVYTDDILDRIFSRFCVGK